MALIGRPPSPPRFLPLVAAMVMSMGAVKNKKTFVVADGVLPQTLSVLRMRAKGFGIKVVVGDPTELVADPAIAKDLCGVLVQYPDVDGDVRDWAGLTAKVHELGGQVTAATDLLALTMLKVRSLSLAPLPLIVSVSGSRADDDVLLSLLTQAARRVGGRHRPRQLGPLRCPSRLRWPARRLLCRPGRTQA
jgi:hypothetical protein